MSVSMFSHDHARNFSGHEKVLSTTKYAGKHERRRGT
jgi:hypothetical protein